MSVMHPSPAYGSFSEMCLEATLAVCNLFPPTIQPTCLLEKTGTVSNLANILLSCVAVSILGLVLIRMSRKLAAVGRKEMMALFTGIAIHLGLQLVTTSNLLGRDSIHLVRISSIQLSLTFALFYALLFNALVGFQFWRDGSRLSMTLLLGGMLALTTGLGAFNVNRAETYLMSASSKSPSTLNDPALYTLYVLWPILASACFLASQFFLVLRSLSARMPLGKRLLILLILIFPSISHTLSSFSLHWQFCSSPWKWLTLSFQ
ncbi:hypothetical protein DSO57_1006068 [Entomophthora muscae]|uniref:Uncharacterized protein n=1 Tax=Entomophthora muscae TaxID=34485 RepID=A0ACC2U5H9_9FUNG|nr:hypothetical protein DSO57_1006068 [Entomophthora muscae]